jgi:2-(1,2-epoxy-1,2-dihydrophenyl)acetyl-CoA isomerase
MSEHPPLRVSRDGPVATLVIDRASALNTLDFALMEALLEGISGVARDDSIRVLVITGAGKHFMAGGDLRSFAGLLDRPGAERGAVFRGLFARLHAAIETLHRMPQITIAQARGAVAGFGLSLLCACDLAVASENAYFSAAYRHVGLSPDGGGTWALPRIVGTRKALEIMLLAERFDAAEALRLGIVNRVVPDVELEAAVAQWASNLVGGPLEALRATKRLVRTSSERTLSEQLDAEAARFVACVASDDFAEGVNAFLGKRPPRFG